MSPTVMINYVYTDVSENGYTSNSWQFNDGMTIHHWILGATFVAPLGKR